MAGLAKAMKDPKVQEYVSAKILGAQLYAYGDLYLSSECDYPEAVMMSIMSTVSSSIVNEDGTPRAFDELAMVRNLEEMLPSLKKRTKKHDKDAKQAMADRQKEEDEIVDLIVTSGTEAKKRAADDS